MPNPSYYSILTADIRYNQNITDSEKILFSELTALANKNGYCHASNKYFTSIYNVSTRTIQNRLKKLRDHGFIKIEIEYYPQSKRVMTRKIYISNTKDTSDDESCTNPHEGSFTTPHEEIFTSPHEKPFHRVVKELSHPRAETCTYNNTRVNTTSMSSTSVNSRASPHTLSAALVQLKNHTTEELISTYNQTCKTLQPYQLKKSDNENIQKLLKSNIDVIRLFQKVESSDYLTGRNERWRGCNFSWIIKPANIEKIIDGCYANAKSKESNEFFELVGKL